MLRRALPEALLVGLALPGETELDDVLALYEGIAEAGVPVRGGDTTAAPIVCISVTALGRSERVPGRAGAQPGDTLVVTGPLGGAGAAFREGATYGLRCESTRDASSRAPPCADGLSDGLAADLGHIARRSGVRCVVELDRVPLADGATSTTPASARTSSCSRPSPDPGGSRRSGGSRQGEGVELLLNGEPYALAGWEHFATGV